MSRSNESSLNLGALVSGVLCLVSLLLSYVVYRFLGVVLFRISLVTMIRVLQPYMIVLPIVGIMMLVMAFCRNRTLGAVTAVAAVAAIVYFLIGAHGIINNETVQWLINDGSTLIKRAAESVGLGGESLDAITDPEQLSTIVETVSSLQHVGAGFVVYCLGVITYIVGFLAGASGTKKTKRTTETNHTEGSIF